MNPGNNIKAINLNRNKYRPTTQRAHSKALRAICGIAALSVATFAPSPFDRLQAQTNAARQVSQPSSASEFEIGDRLTAKTGKQGEFREISWDDLIPAHWQPERFLEEFDMAEMEDNDPRAMEILARIRQEWDQAPVETQFNGKGIRIPGFVVMLDGDRQNIREFLLVPYFGACIHVPPPPLNQLIHVIPDTPIAAGLNMMPVWVSGVMSAQRIDTDLGNAGYQLRAIQVEEYTEPIGAR